MRRRRGRRARTLPRPDETVSEPAPSGAARAVNEGIKRTGPPTTRNGVEWEIVLSDAPPPGWMQLFRSPEDTTSAAVPQSVFFRGRIALFRAGEDQVESWVRSIDQWIAAANRRHAEAVETLKRERAHHDATHTTDKERIRQLNDKFKDL